MQSASLRIRHASLVNLGGAVAPLLVILLTLPFFLAIIGEHRYGALMLLSAVIGYMNVLDLGFGRAVAQRIALMDTANHGNSPDNQSSADTLWSGVVVSLLVGVIGGAVIALFAQGITYNLFNVRNELHSELASSLILMLVALPIATSNSVLSGALQARHAFIPLNIAQATGSILAQIFPFVLALSGTSDLPQLFMAMLIGRSLQTLMLYRACRGVYAHTLMRFNSTTLPHLFRFGGWVSVSGILNPILELTDRFIISHRLGLAAVTAYTVPYTLVTRASLVPGSLTSVLFPRFSAASEDEARGLMQRALATLNAIMTPVVILGILAVTWIFPLWLGNELGERMSPVAFVLLAGIWINSLAYLPYAYLQAQGRPDLPAKLHLIEVIPYLLFLWWAIGAWGVVGAALAWSLRVTLDAVMLFIVAQWYGDRSWRGYRSELLGVLFAACIILSSVLAMFFTHHDHLLATLAGGCILAVTGLWLRLNLPDEIITLLRDVSRNLVK